MVVKSLGGPHSLTSLGHMNPITLRSFVALQVYENWILVIMKKKRLSSIKHKGLQIPREKVNRTHGLCLPTFCINPSLAVPPLVSQQVCLGNILVSASTGRKHKT